MTDHTIVPRLKEVFHDSFRIGAAVNDFVLAERKDILAKHFNSLTAENSMKFESIQLEEGVFDFSEGDRIVAFAKENDMVVRGHTLVWHNQTPEWVFYADKEKTTLASRELLVERMTTHINTVMKHYEDTILCWDVVNEAIEDKGTTRLRDSLWYQIMGEDFLDEAFRIAHQANPKAQLFYNDYNESHPDKTDKIYETVKGMLARGVPIHGIGLQCHWNLNGPSLKNIARAIEKYASLGMRLHITEMDVSVFDFEDRRTDVVEPTEEMLALQADRYGEFFKLFRAYSNAIDSVTFWGVDDAYTWLDGFPVPERKNWPFLLDEKSNPKPAFWSVVNTLGEK